MRSALCIKKQNKTNIAEANQCYLYILFCLFGIADFILTQLQVTIRKIEGKVIAIILGSNGVWILGYSNRFTQITFMPFYGKWSYMVFTSVEIPSEVSQSTKIYWTTTCTGLRLNCEGRDSRPRASGPCPYTIWHAHACLLISYTCPSAIKMNSSYGANKNRNTRRQKI